MHIKFSFVIVMTNTECDMCSQLYFTSLKVPKFLILKHQFVNFLLCVNKSGNKESNITDNKTVQSTERYKQHW